MFIDARALLLVVLTVVLWGAWGFLGKLALQHHMTPVNLFLAEAIVGAFCAMLLAFRVFARPEAQPGHWNAYGVASGAAMAVGLATYYLALERAPASAVVPLTAVYPLVTVLLSHALLHERIGLSQWIGVALICAGSALLLYQRR